MKLRPDADHDILTEARKRFKRAADWEAEARKHWLDDVRFCEGDSDNNWQWPDEVRTPRVDAKRPMLTINKTRQHVLDVLNDARQSRVGVKIIPTGGEATYESAQAYMGVVRAIEYRSNAETAYQHALKGAVQGGIGYWRVLTRYVSNDSFDKEIIIERVKDPELVYLDPDINEADGSDAMFGFIYIDVPKDEFDVQYPAWKDSGNSGNADLGDSTWVTEKHVRIAEYWRKTQTKSVLVGFTNPVTETKQILPESKIPSDFRDQIMKDPDTVKRTYTEDKVEWFKIIGNQIAERHSWEGIYIPIVRVIGEETVIDGKLDRKGHVRALKDAQRMFNYNASGLIEHGALQTKVPWVAPSEAVEDHEVEWEQANIRNPALLTYNHRDEQGELIPSPQRIDAPRPSPLFLESMNTAAEWMRMVSGQYQADMGAPSNERSGAAITARQRQGDLATYHYLDHQSIAIRFTGKILIDLIPKIYDTERVLKYKGDDGSDSQVQINPALPQASTEQKLDNDKTMVILNPKVGQYDVESDVGPSFATKRQDAWSSGMQILQQNRELTSIIGDLVLQNADFPGADEMAQRMKRMVPPQALDPNADPQVAGLQKQLQQAQQLLGSLQTQLANKQAEQQTKGEKVAVEAYRATTDRLDALKEALATDRQGLLVLVREVMEEAQFQSAGGGAEQHASEPVPGLQDIHQSMGGQLQAPAPPVDPNAAPPQPPENQQ